MKKNTLLLGLMLLFLSGSVFAQMDNLANMSAEWMRMNNRNAALDAADIVNYNPAGLPMLTEGFHVNLGNQFLFRHPSHSYDFGLGDGEKKFEQDGADFLLPNLYAAYTTEKWAAYTGIYITGGGATVNYPEGSISTDLITTTLLYTQPAPPPFPEGTKLKDIYTANDQSLEASSYYLCVPFGGAYKVNDWLSLSLGGRWVKGINKTQASVLLKDSPYEGVTDTEINVDTEADASGFGFVVGADLMPVEKLVIGLHYESQVALEFETTVNEDGTGMFEDGSKKHRDLPAVLNTGVSYEFTEKLRAEANFNYYFQKNADWGTMNVGGGVIQEEEISELAGDCFTVGAALAYKATDKLDLSAGFSYTNFMYPNETDKAWYYSEMGWFEALKNPNTNIGIGGSYAIVENIRLNIAAGMTMWKDYDIESSTAGNLALLGLPIQNTTVHTEDNAFSAAIGLNISF